MWISLTSSLFPHRQFPGTVSILALQWQLTHPPLKRAALSVLHGNRGGEINQSTSSHSQDLFLQYNWETDLQRTLDKNTVCKYTSALSSGLQVGSLLHFHLDTKCWLSKQHMLWVKCWSDMCDSTVNCVHSDLLLMALDKLNSYTCSVEDQGYRTIKSLFCHFRFAVIFRWMWSLLLHDNNVCCISLFFLKMFQN